MNEVIRTIVLVADGLGVGELPDAHLYGDKGANTLAHTATAVGKLSLPNLFQLGLGWLGSISGVEAIHSPKAWVGKMAELSAGKDTMTGHWEMVGIVTEEPFALFPNGFPEDLVIDFIKKAGLNGVLGNCAASGTKIIELFGEEHLRTGKPILYTSADSVFQIAAHETAFGLDRLYQLCEVARKCTEPFNIGRVIARPFVGSCFKDFKRTGNRRDYCAPAKENCIDLLHSRGVQTVSVGKIEDIFSHRAIDLANHTSNNIDSLNASLDYLQKCRGEKSFIFSNLVDFDQLYGHRRDAVGYASALEEFDSFLPLLLKELTPNDLLIITGDHGCDPTFHGSDHTREYVPLVVYRSGDSGGNLGIRKSFADLGASLLEAYGVYRGGLPISGESFLDKLKNNPNGV